MSGLLRGPRWRERLQSWPVAVVAALALVVAGWLAQVDASDQFDEDTFVDHHGELGEPTPVGDLDVVVTEVLSARSLGNSEEPAVTSGLHLVVRVYVRNVHGSDVTGVNSADLRAEGHRIFTPVTSAAAAPGPGTQDWVDLAFVVDPERLEGLQLRLWRTEGISGSRPRAVVDLGIDEARANELRENPVAMVEPESARGAEAIR